MSSMSQHVAHSTNNEQIRLQLSRRELAINGFGSICMFSGALLNDGDAASGNAVLDAVAQPIASIWTIPFVIIVCIALWMHVIQAARTVVTPTAIRQPGKLAFWRFTTIPLNDETRVKTVYGWDAPSLTVSLGATSIGLPMSSYDDETRLAIVNLLRYPS
jgi:hypothetical protein